MRRIESDRQQTRKKKSLEEFCSKSDTDGLTGYGRLCYIMRERERERERKIKHMTV